MEELGVRVAEVDSCRMCGGQELEGALNLGECYLPMFPKDPEVAVPKAPLHLVRCAACRLVQLKHSVHPDDLYRRYFYRSGMNQTMRNHLASLASDAQAMANLQHGDVVLDIGCNDGTILSRHDHEDHHLVGFDPAEGLAPFAHVFINDYFSPEVYHERVPKKAKLVYSIAMMYDLDAPRAFVMGISDVLADDGLWVCEVNDLTSMLKNLSFDHICHEHVTYWSLPDLIVLCSSVGMDVVKAEVNPINGGSVRIYVRKGSGAWHHPSVLVASAKETGHYNELKALPWRVDSLHRQAEIWRRKNPGAVVAAYGASTRGVTLMHALGLQEMVQYAVEVNPDKIGGVYSGFQIPIVSEEAMAMDPPDYLLLLPYSYADEFIAKNRALGCKFIIPVPEWRIIE